MNSKLTKVRKISSLFSSFLSISSPFSSFLSMVDELTISTFSPSFPLSIQRLFHMGIPIRGFKSLGSEPLMVGNRIKMTLWLTLSDYNQSQTTRTLAEQRVESRQKNDLFAPSLNHPMGKTHALCLNTNFSSNIIFHMDDVFLNCYQNCPSETMSAIYSFLGYLRVMWLRRKFWPKNITFIFQREQILAT